jgi:gliding motility-associated-like protein
MKRVAVTVDNAPCPSYQLEDSIRMRALPIAHILPGAHTICSGDTIGLSAFNEPNCTYYWWPEQTIIGFGGNVATHASQDMYVHVLVGNQWGCYAKDSVFLDTEPCCNVSLPDAFTPNGDGRNDKFRIITTGHHSAISFQVINRWGQIVFSTTNENEGWDGTIKGVPADIGTYGYLLRFMCDGKEAMQKGSVILIR